jgi:hypothetical protein
MHCGLGPELFQLHPFRQQDTISLSDATTMGTDSRNAASMLTMNHFFMNASQDRFELRMEIPCRKSSYTSSPLF